MTDRAAYTLAAAILTAGGLVAGAVASSHVGRYTFRDGVLLDTGTGEIRQADGDDGAGRMVWRPGVAPVGIPPVPANP